MAGATRRLAGSVVTWPALLVADQLPSDGVLNGKADDFLTGGISALLIVGLLAAGWLKPRWAVLVAVCFLGFAVPMLYETLQPTDCEGESGMDCIPVSFNALFALPGVLLVLVGSDRPECRRVAANRAAAPSSGRQRESSMTMPDELVDSFNDASALLLSLTAAAAPATRPRSEGALSIG